MERDYVELHEKIINKIEEITVTDYNFIGTKILAENCIDIIEDLILAYESLQEEYNDYVERTEEKYY